MVVHVVVDVDAVVDGMGLVIDATKGNGRASAVLHGGEVDGVGVGVGVDLAKQERIQTGWSYAWLAVGVGTVKREAPANACQGGVPSGGVGVDARP